MRRSIRIGDLIVTDAWHSHRSSGSTLVSAGRVALYQRTNYAGGGAGWERVGYLHDGEVGLVVGMDAIEITVLAPRCCGSRPSAHFRRLGDDKA